MLIFFLKPRQECSILFDRLKKNPQAWTDAHTKKIRYLKEKIHFLPCLCLPHPKAIMIVETGASELGYGGILKQRMDNSIEELIRFHFGTWSGLQKNYSTIKKEILSIVLCISKFQDDLHNKRFLLRIDCKSAKEVLQKDVKKYSFQTNFCKMAGYFVSFRFRNRIY